MWLVIYIIVLLIGLLHFVIPRKYNWPSTMWKLGKLPGPPGIPYFDNALSLPLNNEEFIPFLVKLVDQYGPLFKLTLVGIPFVFTTDLDDIEVILSNRIHIKKGKGYEFLVPWLGTGLLISDGKKWFDHRKLLTPTFHFSILEQYVAIINKNANILTTILQSYGEGTPVEINPLITYCALDIICETAMGTQVNAQLGGEKTYVRSVIRMSQIFIKRNLSPWLYRPLIFSSFPIGREHKKLLKVVHGFTERVIKERRLVFRERQNSDKEKKSETFGEKRKISFLDLLIEISECQNGLTEAEIREEVDTFMFEGHDTTSSALIWALFEMGLNPEIQEKVYQEQYNIFQSSNKEPEYSDLQEMKYLERVIKETLRLYPSVPIMSRELEEEIKIKDYVIPAKTQIPIFTYYIHRDPKIYPDPNKFDPDRFHPDVMRGRHPYSYIPFSAGPRNCIGQKFAMMEEKIVLSHIIRKFRVFTVDNRDNVGAVNEIILRPNINIKMIFNKR